MVKLIKKTEKPITKTTLWVVERVADGVKRKQFSLYNTTLEEVEEMLLSKFKER